MGFRQHSLPRVSVCVPTYNGGEHLDHTLESIRQQTFGDIEILVCDDQSTDNTLAIARRHGAGDPRFRVIGNPVRFGLVGNWNNCIRQARGEWIKFVFQDDLVAPTCVERLLTECERLGVRFGFCDRDFIFDSGVDDRQREFYSSHRNQLHSVYGSACHISPSMFMQNLIAAPTFNWIGEPTCTLIHRSVFDRFGCFSDQFVQLCDLEFWMRVCTRESAAWVPESQAAFRVHSGSATSSNSRRRAFRKDVLDSLLIVYRLAYSPEYRCFRRSKPSRRWLLRLRLECFRRAAAARKSAMESARAGDPSGSFGEWKEIVSVVPTIGWLARLGWIVGELDRLRVSGIRVKG